MRAAPGGGPGKRLTQDGDLREQLRYCVPLGIPHSIFLGRIPALGEPQWLPDDMDKALAWKRYEATLCPQCATRDAEWKDEHGEALMPPPYQPVAMKCMGCADVEGLRGFMRDHKVDDLGVYVSLMPFDPDRRPFSTPDGDE